MSRILKRPMFRIGGSANEGIVSMAQPRRQYANSNYEDLIAQYPESKELIKNAASRTALMSAFAGSGRSREDRLSDLLISGGLNLISARPSGGIFSTAASAFKEPTAQYLKGAADEDAFQRQLKLAGVSSAITSAEARELQKMKLEAENVGQAEKLKLAREELFVKSPVGVALGSASKSVFNTLENYNKNNISYYEKPLNVNPNTKRVDTKQVEKIPVGMRFYDLNGDFYVRTEKGYTPIYGGSGKEVVSIVTEKKPGFFDSVKEKGVAYDPRSWNKQKFYESLAKKNQPSTME